MAITIEFNADEEYGIRRRAARAGMAPEDYIRRRLTTSSRKQAAKIAANTTAPPAAQRLAGAALWDELEAAGVLTGYGDPAIDSVDLARQLSATFSRSGGLE
jgi:hypothetical protein